MAIDSVLLAHGSGTRKTSQLIEGIFHTYLDDPELKQMDDAANIGGNLVFTTDTFVVSPLFFPGGDIGRLAVSGTVNDVAVMGAEPRFLSTGFILEEGFPLKDLEAVLASVKQAAEEAGVRVVAGDTKVVERGKGDGIYINTSGIGQLVFSPAPGLNRIEAGDVVLINGDIGVHEIAVLTGRKEFGLEAAVESDVAPLWRLIETLKDLDVRFMRDPTRGGVAQTLNEMVKGRNWGIRIRETELPVTPEVAGVCDILGFDPLHLANEGKVILVVAAGDAEEALDRMQKHPLGTGSRVIGGITENNKGLVTLATTAMGERIVMPPSGELLPRIC